MSLDEAQACEVPLDELPEAEVQEIIKNMRTIAIIGISNTPDRPSFRVADYLQNKGFKIIPVNPVLKEVLGEKAYPDLKAIPKELHPIDVVDIFRKSETVPEIVKEAIAIGAKVIWMQEGVVNNKAANEARAAGLKVVMNRCIKKTYSAFLLEKENK